MAYYAIRSSDNKADRTVLCEYINTGFYALNNNGIVKLNDVLGFTI